MKETKGPQDDECWNEVGGRGEAGKAVISHVNRLKMNEPREGRGLVKARGRVTHVTLTRRPESLETQAILSLIKHFASSLTCL